MRALKVRGTLVTIAREEGECIGYKTSKAREHVRHEAHEVQKHVGHEIREEQEHVAHKAIST